MSKRRHITVDGNEAAASVAHRTNEVIAIYPITPASPMGEHADAWSAQGRPNIWGTIPEVAEMQSEAGAAGTVHGSLQAGALTTTFTASQGLLLMIPNLYKIAGELTPFCMHVAARTLATHALSIFGDHSDVMAVRQTGFGLLCSRSVQEAHDFAAIAQAATLASRVPFIHFFDGFRTSHEVAKIEELTDDDLRAMIDEDHVLEHRARALTPDRPVVRGTAQNPDTFFQAREACNGHYLACPGEVQKAMDRFGELTGRAYRLFDYVGHPEAESVIVMMGSGAETTQQTVERSVKEGHKVGLLIVRLYRPFDLSGFIGALPKTVKKIAVLDRTKEPGALGEPLYLDVMAGVRQTTEALWAEEPLVVGGRYGLSSKEFTPACVQSVYDELARPKPRHGFTVGIVDDVTHLSLPLPDLDAEHGDPTEGVQAIFYGLGSDGTVGANKNSIKIIGQHTDMHAQGYFVYDSKKAGAVTISHLRFGPERIRSAYLIQHASFIACHQFQFMDRYDVLDQALPGAVFLLNAPHPTDEVWDHLPREVQTTIVEKRLRFYAIDAYEVAKAAGLGVRINTIMQTCFFAISGAMEREEAIAAIKGAIEKSYGKRGPAVVKQNFAAVDTALAHLHEVKVPGAVTSKRKRPPIVSEAAPDFVQRVTAVMLANKGDLLPVSAFPIDGTWPVGTSKWEKRNLARQIPVWDPAICIQCNHCTLVCPHSAIRAKVFDGETVVDAPETFQTVAYKAKDFRGLTYSLQVAPEDCTGCTLCVKVCPAKDKSNPRHKAIDMADHGPLVAQERDNYAHFLDIPNVDRTAIKRLDVKGSQFLEPLFESSGACVGCGETPYIKLLTQLFGDRALIANATGCSSIYGGNLPTTPYTTNRDGRGPAWSNSLFEDNAEFGFGFRLAVDEHAENARFLAQQLASELGNDLVTQLIEADQSDEAGIAAQRERVVALKAKLATMGGSPVKHLTALADYLVTKSIWLVGGDGWAYDIGYGGLDHVVAMGRNVNILVLDTEVYSNTGGQQSKATPLGASAKFAAAGKDIPKKDLGLEAISYGNAYVASIAFGADSKQMVKVFREADAFEGTSLIIAYSHCIAHGYDLAFGLTQQARAVSSGVWPLYRFDPRRAAEGQAPLQLDAKAPTTRVEEYMRFESRFRIVERLDPARFKNFVTRSQAHAERRIKVYQQLAGIGELAAPRDAGTETATDTATDAATDADTE